MEHGARFTKAASDVDPGNELSTDVVRTTRPSSRRQARSTVTDGSSRNDDKASEPSNSRFPWMAWIVWVKNVNRASDMFDTRQTF